MHEVNFINWKNILTKYIGTITIWIEVNKKLYNILQDSYWKIFNINIQYEWTEVQLSCSINEEWSTSMMWVKDHWAVKIDIVWWHLLMIDQIQSGKLFINI